MPVRVACEPRRTLLVSRPRSSSASSRPIPPALSRPRPVRCRRPLPPRRRRRTASGRCRRRTTPARATASSPRSTPTTSRTCRSPSPSRPASTAARKRRRSSSATRCTSSRPIPNILYALDLTKPGAPLKWKYEPKPEPAAQGVACCDVVNRGAAFADGKIFFNTLDGHTVAVDAETGKEVWKTKVGDINIGETMTMAPLVVKGKVLVGNSGGEYRRARLAQGARCQGRQGRLDGLLAPAPTRTC